jgi:hypothetical protein
MSIGRTKWTAAEIALLHKLWPVQGKECVTSLSGGRREQADK